MPDQSTPEPAPRYEILVRGQLDVNWSAWFEGLIISLEPDDGPVEITRLSGPVTDQAQLRGILNTIWDLNLCVLSVKRLAEPVPGLVERPV